MKDYDKIECCLNIGRKVVTSDADSNTTFLQGHVHMCLTLRCATVLQISQVS